jgi:hypothetical protein
MKFRSLGFLVLVLCLSGMLEFSDGAAVKHLLVYFTFCVGTLYML